MKIGASYWMFEGGLEASLPVADAIAQAKDLGFDAIELCIASSGVLTHEATQADCERIVATAGELGIEIAGVASGESWGCSPTDDDPAVRAKIVAFTKRACRWRNGWARMPTCSCRARSTCSFWRTARWSPTTSATSGRHAVEQLVPTAEELGVKLGIENVWNKFLLSPLEMRDFIDSFGSAAVGSYFDAGNVLLTGYPEHWISILAQRIVRVHVKDFKKSVGTAAGFVDMLEGDVDFQAVRTALERIGYDGYVTAEMLPYEPGRPEKTAAAMKKLFK